ncbi:MAG: hypothetical protein PUB18_00105, partial [bacterium]|nr:hypothetical protein [bacterium]
RDSKLDNMMSFARKDLHNPFHSGIVKEDIRSGMFALRPDKSKIAVMELGVTKKQYDHLGEVMNSYWLKREELGFNFAGLISMLFFGVGVPVEGEFFCSQWVATVLQEVGIDLFPEKSLYNIRPFDFYCLLQQQIIYEGMSKDYMSNQPITPISAVESKILKKSLKQI